MNRIIVTAGAALLLALAGSAAQAATSFGGYVSGRSVETTACNPTDGCSINTTFGLPGQAFQVTFTTDRVDATVGSTAYSGIDSSSVSGPAGYTIWTGGEHYGTPPGEFYVLDINVTDPNIVGDAFGGHLYVTQGYNDGAGTSFQTQVAYEVSGGAAPPRFPPEVPEPSSWALMILGFGLAGMSLRQRRALGVFA